MKRENNTYVFNSGFKPMITNLEDTSYGVCGAPMTADDSLKILSSYLLGDSFYIAMSVSQEQANAIIVKNILDKYSTKWKKTTHNMKNCMDY